MLAVRQAAFPPGALRRAAARPLTLRCLASRSGGDKSWSEIASEAASVGKDLLKKVGSTVSSAVEKVSDAIVSQREEREPPVASQPRRRGREELGDWAGGGGLLGGLVGRAVGGLVGGAIREMGKQMQQAAQQSEEIRSRAAAVIETSSQVRNRLGPGVRVGLPVSQSSMTQVINGVSSRRVTLLLPVSSSRGPAQADVSFVEGGQAGREGDLSIRLRLPSGEVLDVNVAGGYAGKTIDVEWREL